MRHDVRNEVGGLQLQRKPRDVGDPGAPKMLCGGISRHMRAILSLSDIQINGKESRSESLIKERILG